MSSLHRSCKECVVVFAQQQRVASNSWKEWLEALWGLGVGYFRLRLEQHLLRPHAAPSHLFSRLGML